LRNTLNTLKAERPKSPKMLFIKFGAEDEAVFTLALREEVSSSSVSPTGQNKFAQFIDNITLEVIKMD
jgi:hypothetical protein